MPEIAKDEDFICIPKAIDGTSGSSELTKIVMSTILMSKPTDIKKHEYKVLEHDWIVYDAPTFKMTLDKTDHHYHCFFSKITGLNIRFGKAWNEDPVCCELGPEILDLEISVGGCPPVKGSSNCRYCYKNNTNRAPKNMSFETFKQLVESFPKNLSQIAFGITGLQTNPDLPKMLKHCREIGIIPNLTTVGADLDENMKDVLCENCGAVAVSCYTGAKELCYKTIKELHDHAKEKFDRDMHINMHIVVSEDNMPHLMEVLQDIADKKVEGLKSVVLLRIKPKGRAASMNCTVKLETYEKLVNFCLDNKISFGFDSCSATPVIEVLKKIGREELCTSCEKCESSSLSAYINVLGQYWSCSFMEGRTDVIKPIDVLEYEHAYEWWNSDPVKFVRQHTNCCKQSCPWYNLD